MYDLSHVFKENDVVEASPPGGWLPGVIDYLTKMRNPLQMAHARIAQTGMVIIQAAMILPPTVQRTEEIRFEAPTPIIDEEMICVVESGMPM